MWIIDPDKLARRIVDAERLAPPDANLKAVQRIETWLYASVETHQSVGVETVLSTDKYLRLITAAHERQMLVRLVYVVLDSAALNIERVKIRVRKGGHDVPHGKIESRRARSLALLPQFLAACDEAFIFDNSGAEPKLIAEKTNGRLTCHPGAIPEIVAAVAGVNAANA